MDISEKDERNRDNYDSVNNPPPPPSEVWRVSDSSYHHPENLISSSCSPSQMMDSFGQTLWYDPTAVGYGGGFNHHPSSSSSFRGNNIDRSLEMGWSLPNLLPPKGNNNGLFLPNPTSSNSFLPPSMAQFPADSGFIERAARFSLFSGGNFSDMVNQPLANPESSIGLFLQGQQQQQQCPSNNEVNVVEEAHKDSNVRSSEQAIKPNVPGSGNVSEDTQSSGGGGNGRKNNRETSESKKRKRNGQDSEADRSHQSEEEGDDKKQQSPNSGGNKTNSGKQEGKQTSDPVKDGYIHVRARRGQATNSHSLAERVRREKISERMKFLQDLVPGCNKVTGKAVMLDEIINYVQSLQRQVEFLSMKLATVNPQMDFNLDSLLAKDLGGAGTSSAAQFPQNVAMVYPPIPHGFMQQTLSNIGRTISSPLSPMNSAGFKRQETNGWEGDLQNVIHINYGAADVSPPDPQAAATASVPGANMKETNGWEGDLQNVIHINYGAADVSPPDPQAAATASVPGANMKVES